jgi:hypothetical protein
MWGCTRWPECRGVINVDPPTTASTPDRPATEIRAGVPGAYAQARHERERRLGRLKRRAALPLVVGTAVIVMLAVFLGFQSLGVPVASVASVAVGLVFLYALYRLPFESLMWAKGAEGERKTAAFLEPLLDAGFVVLYNRQIPGEQGDIDSLVIGPTGVFPIETKNWGHRLEVRNDRLYVGDYDRTSVVKQVYRLALAVQVALGEELTKQRVTVTPVICAVGGMARFDRMAGGVHVTEGKGLARLLSDRPIVFDDEAVQRIARLADERLRLRYPWEAE